jgi:parallel beta-helix repeat protein
LKKLLCVFAVAVLLLGLGFVGNFVVPTAQAATQVNGVINQDTTWTKANSPYNLVGNVLVSQGRTLTIQSGVTVNLGDYYLMVNGTLSAIGSSGNLLQFIRGSITFTSYSSSGSTIDYANLTTTPISINGASPKISNSYTASITVNGDSPTISYNNINGEINILGGSPTISNNQIKTTAIKANSVFSQLTIYTPVNAISIFGSPIISNNVITGGGQSVDNYGRQQGTVSAIQVNSGSPTFSGNWINGEQGGALQVFGSCTISNNTIIGAMGFSGGSSTLTNNDITGAIAGTADTILSILNNKITVSQIYAIDLGLGSSVISNNVLNGGGIQYGSNYGTSEATGSVAITGNLIDNAYAGINIQQSSNLTIQSNTIANNNGNGITIANSPTGKINYNNFQNNTPYNIGLGQGQSSNVDATNNWWGTTDQQAISQTIYDFNNDFNLGTVNFVPFLTSPNSDAPVISTQNPSPNATPVESASPSKNPTATPLLPVGIGSLFNLSLEQTALVVMAVVIAVLAIALVLMFRKRNSGLVVTP